MSSFPCKECIVTHFPTKVEWPKFNIGREQASRWTVVFNWQNLSLISGTRHPNNLCDFPRISVGSHWYCTNALRKQYRFYRQMFACQRFHCLLWTLSEPFSCWCEYDNTSVEHIFWKVSRFLKSRLPDFKTFVLSFYNHNLCTRFSRLKLVS